MFQQAAEWSPGLTAGRCPPGQHTSDVQGDIQGCRWTTTDGRVDRGKDWHSPRGKTVSSSSHFKMNIKMNITHGIVVFIHTKVSLW